MTLRTDLLDILFRLVRNDLKNWPADLVRKDWQWELTCWTFSLDLYCSRLNSNLASSWKLTAAMRTLSSVKLFTCQSNSMQSNIFIVPKRCCRTLRIETTGEAEPYPQFSLLEPRMHSSRMRTVRCSGRGVSARGICPGGVSAQEGCLSRRRVCSGGQIPPCGQNDRHV